MDVTEFFSEFRRMCKSSSDCTKCQYHGDKCDNVIELLEKTVSVVEQWSREHPRKTRQDVFLEQWPNAAVYGDGVLAVAPCRVDKITTERCVGTACGDCRREFWMQEVE